MDTRKYSKLLKYVFTFLINITNIEMYVGLGRCHLCEWVMVFNSTFNNISAISWRSVLLVEETGIPGENDRLTTSH
jgi:hypothetical protein